MKKSLFLSCLFVLCFPFSAIAAEKPEPIQWETDYGTASAKARAENKMLFIEFYSEKSKPVAPSFNAGAVADHVFLALAYDADDSAKKIRSHSAFSALSSGSGWVIIDYKHKGFKSFERVVSVMPSHKLTRTNFEVLIRLPMGTLTQRTLVWAVRQHPYSPQSTSGQLREDFLNYVESWASEMARSCNQRHGAHPGNSEIVAETFGSRTSEVTEAAEEILSMWGSAYDYQRDGHWSAVLGGWDGFAYDMAYNPSRGTWYAVGVFAGRKRFNCGEQVPPRRGTNMRQTIRQR